jgi:hypothetical protein
MSNTKFPYKTPVVSLAETLNPDGEFYQKYLKQLDEWNKENPIIETKIEIKPKIELDYLDLNTLLPLFYNSFLTANKKEFDKNINGGEVFTLLKTIFYYLSYDERFFNSPLLNQITTPGFHKGLFIIGGFGCGKTAIMKAICHLSYEQYNSIVKDIKGNETEVNSYFKSIFYFSANEVVEMFENCSTNEQKTTFWSKMKSKYIYFDDLLTERIASNYGKVELFKDILEKRENDNKITHVSCNYVNGSLEQTLDLVLSKYGGRVHDRFYSMFNVIELKGKSNRK